MDQNATTPATTTGMTRAERRAAAALGAVFFLRMLGLFMVLPVLPLHAGSIPGATPLLAGLALGGYGISQGFLQIPFGILSDRYGRKRVITAGLLVYAAGGLVAGAADTIFGIIAGRILQGTGAVAAAIMALAADVTRDGQRTQAMAYIGISIGMSFLVAFVAGPVIDAAFGMRAVFWGAAACGLGAIALLHLAVPDPPRQVHHADCQADAGSLRRVLRDGGLWRHNAGVFCLHLAMTAVFVVLPGALRDHAGLPTDRHWALYLPVLVGSVAIILPWLRGTGDGRREKAIVLGSIAMLTLATAGFALGYRSLAGLAVLLTLYFAAFNLLEALLPALVSRAAPLAARGTALGVYATSQFIGSFTGGVLGGALMGIGGPVAVFAGAALVGAAWLGIAASLPASAPLRREVVAVGSLDAEAAVALQARLVQVAGVADAAVVVEEGVAYLLVDPRRIDRSALAAASPRP